MNKVDPDNFNETMKGYIVRACRIIECDDKEVSKLFNGIRWSIDEMTMEDARKEYERYRSGKIQFK